MSVDAKTSFSLAIQQHLHLKQRNAELAGDMPIDRYAMDDPFENHPLFKSEDQARLEETLESVVDAPSTTAVALAERDEPADDTSRLPGSGDDSTEGPALVDGLWGKSRDFDWGD